MSNRSEAGASSEGSSVPSAEGGVGARGGADAFADLDRGVVVDEHVPGGRPEDEDVLRFDVGVDPALGVLVAVVPVGVQRGQGVAQLLSQVQELIGLEAAVRFGPLVDLLLEGA
ncbi:MULTISPECIES: hypothetical protein [unclassified Streptomyces]|uniref:hypothetical protein n=1 Tax=unclassified Streptomyces TaxID=2593676 RepID=UPI003243C191